MCVGAMQSPTASCAEGSLPLNWTQTLVFTICSGLNEGHCRPPAQRGCLILVTARKNSVFAPRWPSMAKPTTNSASSGGTSGTRQTGTQHKKSSLVTDSCQPDAPDSEPVFWLEPAADGVGLFPDEAPTDEDVQNDALQGRAAAFFKTSPRLRALTRAEAELCLRDMSHRPISTSNCLERGVSMGFFL